MLVVIGTHMDEKLTQIQPPLSRRATNIKPDGGVAANAANRFLDAAAEVEVEGTATGSDAADGGAAHQGIGPDTLPPNAPGSDGASMV